MTRRLLIGALALGLAGTGALSSPAAADPDPDQTQDLDLGGVTTARLPADVWSPLPIRPGAPPLHLAIDAADAAVCELSDDLASVEFLTVGDCHVTAYAPAYTGYMQSPDEFVTFTVSGHTTTTELTAAPATREVGDQITLTAVVDSNGHGQPAGTVEFTRDGVSVGSDTLEADDPGDDFTTAEVTVTAPESGDLDYVATYVPGSPTTWAASNDTDRVVATKRAVTVTAVPSTGAVTVGGTVTLAITAKNGSTDVAPAASPAVVGTVTVDGDPVSVTWQTGTTTVTLPTTDVGTHDVEVDFRPSDPTTYAVPGTKSASYAVGAATTTELDVDPAGPLVGDGVVLTGTVDSDGTGEPAGKIEFLRKGSGGSYAVIGTVDLVAAADPAADRSAAELSVTAESSAARTYAARYLPTDAGVHAASTSTDEEVTPVQRTVDVTVGTPASPVTLGQNVTIPIAGTTGVAATAVDQDATTTVTLDGTPVSGLTWTHGATSLALTAPTAGTHTVVVTFVPDDDDRYLTPSAVTTTFDVTIPTTSTLSAAPTGVLVGDPATFTATVTTSGHGKPLGTIELLRVGAGGTLTKVDEDTDPALASGSTDTLTADLEVVPANATPTDYRVRFVPTDPADFAASSSSPDRTLTAVRRTVAVAVDVPTTDVATTEPVTVTVDATHGGAGVPGDGTTTVTFNDTPVTGLDWADGSESFTVTPSATGTQTVKVTFVPDDTDRYATPSQVTKTFVAKRRQTITAQAAAAAPHYAEGTTTISSSGTHGTVTLAERTPTTCTVASGTVTFLTAGTCTVRVEAAGSSTYLPGFQDVTVTVAARPVDVAIVLETLPAVYGDAVLISASATALGSTSPLTGTGTVTVRRQGAPVGEAAVLSSSYTYGGAKITLSGAEVDDYDVTVTYTPPSTKTGIHATTTETRTLSIGRATQDVAFGSSTGHLYVDETWTTPATGSRSGTAAGLQVVGGTAAVCEVVGGTDLHFKRSGTCTVKATVAQDSRYQAVDDTTSFTVALRPVDVAVTVAAEDTTDTAPRYQEWVVVTATATDRLDPSRKVAGTGTIRVVTHDGATTPTTLTFDANGVATRRFKPTALGSDSVKVAVAPSNVAGVATYAARAEPVAPATDATFTVAQGRQPITWGASDTPEPASRLVDATWDSDARGGASGKPVVVTSLTPTVCSVSGTVVTMLAAAGSSCQVRADQEGSTNYLAGTRTATIAVTARPVTVGVSWPAGKHVYHQPVVITATARDTTAGTTVPDLGSGTADSERSGSGTIVIDGVPQSVVFRNGVATYSFTPDDVADFTVRATFAPNRQGAYAVTPDAAATLSIAKADQAVLAPTVDPPAAPNIGDTWAPAVASGGSSAPVVVTSLTTSVCTVTDRPVSAGGPLVTFVALSGCTVRLSQEGDDHYEDATPVPVSVTVVKLAVDLTITGQATARRYGDATTLSFAAKATKAPHGAVPGTTTVTVTDVTTGQPVPTTGLLTVDAPAGTAVLTLGTTLLTGQYDVRADFTATRDDLYGPTFRLASFTITLAPQTVALATGQTAPTAVRVGSASWTPVFATTASGTPVALSRRDAASVAEPQPEYESDPDWNPPTHACTLTDGTVAFTSQGSCVVRAVAPGVTRKYAASDPVDYTVAVTRVPVSLDLSAEPATDVVVGDEVRVKAVAKVGNRAATGTGPLTVTGELDVPSPSAPWFGGGSYHTFSPAHAGSYDIAAFFHPDDPVTYQNIEREITLSVAPGSQVVALVGEQPTAVRVNDTWTPETSGGGSGNPVEITVDEDHTDSLPSDPDAFVCSVAAGVVSFVGHGTCQLVLSQVGDADYADADDVALAPITISRTTTTVTLQASATARVGVPFTVSARVVGGATQGPIAGGGGGPVVVTIGGVEVARVTGAWENGFRTLTFTPERAGALVATATYTAEDDAAFEGDDDTLTRTVTTGAQWVRIGLEPPSPAYVDATWTPRMTGGGAPGADPVLSATPTSVCSATADTVTFRTSGHCVVRATMAAVEVGGSTSWDEVYEERTFDVRAHPTTVVVTEPAVAQRFVARTIDMRAQVTGRPSGTGTPVSVPGTVQFTVDGHPRGAPVTVSPTGLATAQITVPVDPSVDPGEGPYDHRFGADFTPTETRYWAVGTAESHTIPISLNPQTIQPDDAKSPLYIGQTWTPRVRISPAGALAPVVTLRSEDTDICSYDGTVVRLEAVDTVAPIDTTCDLDYTQPGNGEWAEAANRSQGIEIRLRPADVDLTVGTAVVASPVTLSVSVVSPAVAATLAPITSGLDALAPAGTVTFAAGGTTLAVVPVTLDPADPTKPGTASTSYVPARAGDVAVTATFQPTDTTLFADGVGSQTVSVARATTTTSITAVTANRITALVERSVDPASTMSGDVTFSYTVVGSSAPAEHLGTVALGSDRRAVLTGAVPPAGADVLIRADYAGDTDHAASFGTRRRDLPIVTPQVDGKRTGWNGGPVTVRFTCAPSPIGGAAIASCPDPVTLRGDGRGQSVTRAGTAEDGGRTAATVTGLDIDDTAPSVRVGGTVAGASYRGTAPAATCLGTDALSGIASCEVTRTQLPGRSVRDTAVAIDRAGNRATASITYEVRQEWVANAPLVRGGYQVRPGTTQKIIARTEGPQPQLMLPGAKGKLVPAKVFSASKIDNGIITWFVEVKVPKSVRVGQRYRVGFRLSDDRDTIIKLRLDVVRKPATDTKNRGRKKRR